jgi:von Willebrand factor type A domain
MLAAAASPAAADAQPRRSPPGGARVGAIEVDGDRVRLVVTPPVALSDPDEDVAIDVAGRKPWPSTSRRLPNGDLEVVVVVESALGPSYLRAVQDDLDAFLAALADDSRVGVVAAGERGRVLQSPTADRAAVQSAVRSITADTVSSTASGLTAATRELTPGPGVRRVIVLVTRGGYGNESQQLDEVGRRLQSLGVAAYVVQPESFFVGTETSYPAFPLGAGRFVPVPGDVATELSNQYVVELESQAEGPVTVELTFRTDTAAATRGAFFNVPRSPERGAGDRVEDALPVVIGIGVGIILLGLVVLLPPRRRRARAARRVPTTEPPVRILGGDASRPEPGPDPPPDADASSERDDAPSERAARGTRSTTPP